MAMFYFSDVCLNWFSSLWKLPSVSATMASSSAYPIIFFILFPSQPFSFLGSNATCDVAWFICLFVCKKFDYVKSLRHVNTAHAGFRFVVWCNCLHNNNKYKQLSVWFILGAFGARAQGGKFGSGRKILREAAKLYLNVSQDLYSKGVMMRLSGISCTVPRVALLVSIITI